MYKIIYALITIIIMSSIIAHIKIFRLCMLQLNEIISSLTLSGEDCQSSDTAYGWGEGGIISIPTVLTTRVWDGHSVQNNKPCSTPIRSCVCISAFPQ